MTVAALYGLVGALAAIAPSLAYRAPAEWTAVPTSSPMRLAEWRVGDRSTIVIFYFGPGQGGSADANVDRWIAQFEQPDGTPTRDRAKRTELRVGELKVTRVDIAGRYVAPLRPGAPERNDEPDTRMIAAVVEGTNGPWFVRLLGPRGEVAKEEAAFDGFLSTLQLQ